MSRQNWFVIDTPMFPARWKVVPVSGISSNATHYYFRLYSDAMAYASKLERLENTA